MTPSFCQVLSGLARIRRNFSITQVVLFKSHMRKVLSLAENPSTLKSLTFSHKLPKTCSHDEETAKMDSDICLCFDLSQ
jgi:hypothetical protein